MKPLFTRFVTLILALYLSAGYSPPVLAFGGGDNGWEKTEITFDLDVNIINACRAMAKTFK